MYLHSHKNFQQSPNQWKSVIWRPTSWCLIPPPPLPLTSGETQETPHDMSESEEGSLRTWLNLAQIKLQSVNLSVNISESRQIDFHHQWWLFNKEDSHDPTLRHNVIKLLLSFVFIFFYLEKWHTVCLPQHPFRKHIICMQVWVFRHHSSS